MEFKLLNAVLNLIKNKWNDMKSKKKVLKESKDTYKKNYECI